MAKAKTIIPLADDASAAADEHSLAKEEARKAALRAIAKLESDLLTALDGRGLRGLKNLTAESKPFYAAHLRRKDPDEKLEKNETSLVVDARGFFRVVTFRHLGPGRIRVHHRRAQLDDYKAEDLPLILRSLEYVLQRHITLSKAASARYERITELANRITAATKGD